MDSHYEKNAQLLVLVLEFTQVLLGLVLGLKIKKLKILVLVLYVKMKIFKILVLVLVSEKWASDTSLDLLIIC